MYYYSEPVVIGLEQLEVLNKLDIPWVYSNKLTDEITIGPVNDETIHLLTEHIGLNDIEWLMDPYIYSVVGVYKRGKDFGVYIIKHLQLQRDDIYLKLMDLHTMESYTDHGGRMTHIPLSHMTIRITPEGSECEGIEDNNGYYSLIEDKWFTLPNG